MKTFRNKGHNHKCFSEKYMYETLLVKL